MDPKEPKDEAITAPSEPDSTNAKPHSPTQPDLQIHAVTATDLNVNTPPDDPEALTKPSSHPPHTVFTRPQRIFISIMITLACFFSPLSGQIYYPIIPILADEYHTSIGHINLTITTYMILQGLAPTIMGTFGDTTGRRPAYILTFTIYLGANIGLAVQNSYAALLVLRCLQSAGSSSTIALGYGVISDIATPAERGKYLGPAAAGAMLAPAIAPTIGGLLAQYIGWRSIFWFLTIMSGAFLLVYAFFMPETSRQVVGDGSNLPSDWWVMTPSQYWTAQREKRRAVEERGMGSQEPAKKRKFQFPNPIASIMILLEKDALLVICFTALGMFIFMALLASMPPMLGQVYGFNAFQIGLCYL